MINFFRKIRKQLADDNKPMKYLRYAIGEILLVVIGILIALSINNWNESRKERIFERKVLSEILVDTEEDLTEMDSALASQKSNQISYNIILNQFERSLEYNDSLDSHFANALKMWSLSPNSTAFEMAKTEGMHIIKNDSIRTMVAKINDYYFDYVRVLESRWQDYNTNIVLPYCIQLFDYYNFEEMKPTNYRILQTDSTYQGILKTLHAMRTRYIDWLERRYEVLVSLNAMIKSEIK